MEGRGEEKERTGKECKMKNGSRKGKRERERERK